MSDFVFRGGGGGGKLPYTLTTAIIRLVRYKYGIRFLFDL